MNELRHHWTLDPDVVFLNHGSFGACPRPVLARQDELRAQMEREPVRFFVREAPALLNQARELLAAFVGADADRLAFVHNATAGVNAVLRSLHLRAGDRLLVTDHEYNACRNVLDFVAERAGCAIDVAAIPFPLASADQVVEAICAAVRPATRLLLIDHVTSQTGLVFPIERIVGEMNARGVDTLVDGAHAPGMVPLQLEQLGATWYTGNCHKWLCTPKGAALLHVREDRRDELRPAIISHGANAPPGRLSRFRHEFDWMGTTDITPFLCVEAALQFQNDVVPGGIAEVRRRNRELVLAGRALLCDALSIAPPAPDALIGSLAAVPLPDSSVAGPLGAFDIDPLQQALFHEDHIEVPVMPWPRPPGRMLRISAQLYNEPAEYQHLARCVRRHL